MVKTEKTNCPHCGNIHQHKCPLVKAIEYHQGGTVKRVEYMTPVDYQYVQIPNYNTWSERNKYPPLFDETTC